MDLCLSAGNLEAHYLRGMQEYFQKENIAEGLAHLQIAEQGLYDNCYLPLWYNNDPSYRQKGRDQFLVPV